MHLFTRHISPRLLTLTGSLLLLLALITACGSSGTGAGSTGTGSSGNTPTGSPTVVKGYGSAQGCPSDAVMSNLPPAPNVVIQAQQANSTINAKVGDTIEVRLPFGHKWSGPASTQGSLQLQQPAGYAVKTQSVCVWRFVAQSSGESKLAFTSQALCKPGSLCPMYIAVFSFTINVK